MWFQVDPFNLILESRCPYIFEFENSLLRFMIFAVRWILLQWSILEGTRVYTINLITIMTFCNSYLNIASHLQNYSFGDKLISLYNQFHYINQIGQTAVAKISGVLMGFGVALFVVLNYVSICEWSRLPAELYFVNVGFAVVAYCVVFQTLPKLVNCVVMLFAQE